jgi:CDP-glucose 4,6-dehydratase
MERNTRKILLKKFKGRKVLITGVTGFKGSWLSFLLDILGAKVFGIGLYNKNNFLFNNSGLKKKIKYFPIDIRDKIKFQKVISKIKPEIIYHLASESLVINCHKKPYDAISTNIVGLFNLLDFFRNKKTNINLNIITSDKCYLPNKKKLTEVDSLGGNDIYSATKACQEVLTRSYFFSYLNRNKNLTLNTFRAGNVIGGGDFSENRFFNDLFFTLKKKKIIVRNPEATRPWQHVLDCLFSYLLVSASSLNKNQFENWNIAPPTKSQSVKWILNHLIKKKFIKKELVIFKKNKITENIFLNLSSTKFYKKYKFKNYYKRNKLFEETLRQYIVFEKNKKKPKKLNFVIENYVKMYLNNVI